MADKTYRVAVIGRTGKGNYGHGIDTVWASVPGMNLVAVADENDAGRAAAQARLKAPQAYADYRDMLAKERPQIVGIGPRWIDQHHEIALACAEHGCHMYLEKPFVQTLAQADAVIAACEMRHLKLAVAHQTRYSPTVHMAKKLIAAGEIGDVLEVRGRGKEDARGGGEDLWVLGSHVLDLTRFLIGNPIDCTATVTSKGRPISAADLQPGNEGLGPLAGDAIQARFRFDHGVVGDFASVRQKGGTPSRFGVQVFGSKGVLDITSGYLEPVWLLKDVGWNPGRSGAKWLPVSSRGIEQPETVTSKGLGGGNIHAVTDLVECIESDRQPICSMYDGRASIEMILAVFESQRVGHTVTLPLKSREHPLALLAAGK